jgi:PAS domain S-box-containing protein
VTSFDGTLRFLNRAGRELLGHVGDDAALVGSLFPAHTPAARELLLDEVIPAALRDGTITCDTALQAADGRVFPASQTVVVTPNGVGLPLTLTLVIRNVGIERHQTSSLGESHRLFEMIARASPDLICLYDPADERVVWMNRCVHAFLGGTECDARTLSRREMHRLVHPIDRARFRANGARMAEAYGDSDTLTNELRVRTSGGQWRWLHTRATVFSRRETGAPLLLLGVATDITARKKTERQLCAERDAAEHATLARNEFLSRMSEHVRGTLHGMLGIAAEVRADREYRLTARERDQLTELISGGTTLLGTISDLHDYTQIEAGEMAVMQTLTDVRDVVRTTVDSFCDHPLRTRGAIALTLPDAAAPVLTDPSRLRQALSHLVASALSQSIDGLVTVTMRVDAD